MKAFIIGIAGGTGRRIARLLVDRGWDVDGLVRGDEQLRSLAGDGIEARIGDFTRMSVDELAVALRGCEIIVFSAGAGGKGGEEATTAIDGEGPGRIASAANLAGVARFYLISAFPEAWRGRHMAASFEHYLLEKKRAEADLVRRDLDWVVVRPSALFDDPGTGEVDLGPAKIHGRITRDDVAATIVALIAEPSIKRVILEVTAGTTSITSAVAELVRR
ncbi:NAD(P)H-binding protein [Sphingomonas morindae]|uniref:NAD(P)H-binding protein n=1 Tax=Sphingomonas morindae TaxID=1541170 RepID=A0ABY4XAD1_9SPHN|nr:NAD(P)H-binding protein [Sphingomonas morindae]USI73883.1 NAD(P)H-binding protein [Sphingomonas morindae]